MNDLYDASAPGQATELGSQQWATSESPPATLALARAAQRRLTDLALQADSARDQVLQIFAAIEEHRQGGVPTTFDVATELDDTSDRLLDLMGRIHSACDPYTAWDDTCGAASAAVQATDDHMIRVELAGREASDHFAVVESASDAIVGVDTAGKIVAWNAAAEHLFGWSRDEAVGSEVSLFVPAEDLAGLMERCGQVVAGGTVDPFVTDRLHRDGHTLAVRVQPSSIFTADGEVVAVVAAYQPYRRASDGTAVA